MESAFQCLAVAFGRLWSGIFNSKVTIVVWMTFLVAGAISFAAEYRAQRQPLSIRSFLNHCFPWREWKGPSVRVDVALYLLGQLTTPAIHAATLVLASTVTFQVSRCLDSFHHVAVKAKGGILAIALLSIVLVLTADLANYLSHRMEHKIPLLWEFHKVHHSASFLSPLTTARSHPLEKMFDGIFMAVFVGLVAGVARHVYGLSVAELMGISAAANLIVTLIVMQGLHHSHFPIGFGPLERVLISPRMHQLHHSIKLEHWDKNMGNRLSIWDWCFNSGFRPAKGEALKYGTGYEEEDSKYQSILNCYLLPLVRTYRFLIPNFRGSSPAPEAKQLDAEQEG